MTIEQTVEVPADHRVFFEFLAPREIPIGKARVELKLTPVVEKSTDHRSVDQSSVNVLKNTDVATPHTDALLEIVSKIGGNIDPDEIRAERLAKHLK